MKYPKGYKPRVCIASFKLIYYPESAHSNLTSKNKERINHAMKEVRTIECDKYSIVLDEENNFPTKNIKKNLIRFIWKEKKIKVKMDNIYTVIRDLKIHSESRVCYKFNELIH